MTYGRTIVCFVAVALAMSMSIDEALAQRCKYTTGGTGNCLSPAFYACQKNWTACANTCEAIKDAKNGKSAKRVNDCKDACEVKYAAICGD